MKKYKFNTYAVGLPVGWIFGMLIAFPFIHPDIGWLVFQLGGLMICLMILLLTMKRIDK